MMHDHLLHNKSPVGMPTRQSQPPMKGMCMGLSQKMSSVFSGQIGTSSTSTSSPSVSISGPYSPFLPLTPSGQSAATLLKHATMTQPTSFSNYQHQLGQVPLPSMNGSTLSFGKLSTSGARQGEGHRYCSK